ncbi:MAG: hypothetical protein Kow0069_35130 [Promethearchaeota archaeon]
MASSLIKFGGEGSSIGVVKHISKNFLLFCVIVGKISKKGQVVIPKEIRDRFGLRPGDTVVFKIVGGKVLLEKVSARLVDILLAGKSLTEPSVDFQERLRDEWN